MSLSTSVFPRPWPRLIAGAFMAAALFIPPESLAQHAVVDSVRTEWLRSRTVDLDGLMNGSDLPPAFVDAIRTARIVAVGEATHGDGSGFEVRNALTQALHESLGFDILALEATGYHQAESRLESEFPASVVVDSMQSYLWRSSAQARKGLLYAAKTIDSARPLRIRGIDVQHRGADVTALFDVVESTLHEAGLMTPEWPTVRDILSRTLRSPFAPIADSVSVFVTERARDLVEDLRPLDRHAALLLETALANALVPWSQSMNPRDRQMGKLLVYLAESDAPDDRIVLWAASSHAVKNLPAIDTLEPSWSYDKSLSMGEIVADSLNDDYYVIAMTACGGSYGASAIGIPERAIDPPDDRSLEALACSLPFEKAAFLDIRGGSAHPGGRWLSSPLLARPLGYAFKRASWPLVLDGLIFVRDMQPSTPYSP